MVEGAHPQPEVLTEHWRWRPDWTPDRPCLWWYLTFEDQPAVARLGRQVTSGLAGSPYVDVNPPGLLHLTLREVGFTDEVPVSAVDATVEDTRRSLTGMAPFEVDVGHVGTLPGAITLWAEPTAAVERLRDGVVGQQVAQLPTAVPDPEALRPHVSVAYVRRDCLPQQVLGLVPPTSTVTVSVSRVTLAEVTRRRHHYEWTVRARVPLGA
jgi:2'-5' RNA ligase